MHVCPHQQELASSNASSGSVVMVGAKEALKQSTKQQEHHLYQHRHSGSTAWASKATVQVCKGQAIHVMVQLLLVSEWLSSIASVYHIQKLYILDIRVRYTNIRINGPLTVPNDAWLIIKIRMYAQETLNMHVQTEQRSNLSYTKVYLVDPCCCCCNWSFSYLYMLHELT